jgi:hypothetical protein
MAYRARRGTMTEKIKVTRDGAVETIAFSNPPKNFISSQMLRELYFELLRARKDESVRVLVLTGGMKDSFISHYDVSELIEYSRRAPKNPMVARFMSWLMKNAQNHPILDGFLIRALSLRSPAEQGIYFWARGTLSISISTPKGSSSLIPSLHFWLSLPKTARNPPPPQIPMNISVILRRSWPRVRCIA